MKRTLPLLIAVVLLTFVSKTARGQAYYVATDGDDGSGEGVIAGQPSKADALEFTVEVTDSAGSPSTDSKAFSLAILADQGGGGGKFGCGCGPDPGGETGNWVIILALSLGLAILRRRRRSGRRTD